MKDQRSLATESTGQQQLGTVAGHWPTVRLKYVAEVQTGLTLGKDYKQRPLVSRPYLRVANVQDGFLDLSTITTVHIPEAEIRRYELRPGDVLMTEGGDFDKLGRGYIWEGQIAGCLHQNHIFAVRPDPKRLDARFLATLLTSAYGKAYFTSTSQQSTNLATTTSTKLGDFSIPLPSLDEQLAVVSFVSRKTAAFDGVIHKKERLLELLQEKRQVIVSQAVTQGVDSRVPLKSSGVVGLPQVPADWDCLAVKHLLKGSPKNGVSPPTATFGDGIPSFSISAVRDGQVQINDNLKYAAIDHRAATAYRVSRGDILVIRDNGNLDLVGTCGLVSDFPAGCIYPDILIKIEPKPRVLREFLVAALNGPDSRMQFQALARTANGTYKISGEDLTSIKLPLPPLEVQRDIISHLAREAGRLDYLTSALERQIAKLREYRQALISAAVTGKVDVRTVDS